jgi:hypothetical protein
MTAQKVIIVRISSAACENKQYRWNIASFSGRLLASAKRNHALHRMLCHDTEMNHSQFSWLIEFLILCRNAHAFLHPEQANTSNLPHTVEYDSPTRRQLSFFRNTGLPIYHTVHDSTEIIGTSFQYLCYMEQITEVWRPHDIYQQATATVLASELNSVDFLREDVCSNLS